MRKLAHLLQDLTLWVLAGLGPPYVFLVRLDPGDYWTWDVPILLGVRTALVAWSLVSALVVTVWLVAGGRHARTDELLAGGMLFFNVVFLPITGIATVLFVFVLLLMLAYPAGWDGLVFGLPLLALGLIVLRTYQGRGGWTFRKPLTPAALRAGIGTMVAVALLQAGAWVVESRCWRTVREGDEASITRLTDRLRPVVFLLNTDPLVMSYLRQLDYLRMRTSTDGLLRTDNERARAIALAYRNLMGVELAPVAVRRYQLLRGLSADEVLTGAVEGPAGIVDGLELAGRNGFARTDRRHARQDSNLGPVD